MQPASIIATVRNEKKTITDFVDSLLDQSYKPEEIIIVDGVSTDGTRELLEEYDERGEIILLSEECNIAQGRNIGIRKASSEIIAVTDAGCLVSKTWLENIMNCFSSTPEPDVVAGNFRFDCHTLFEEVVSLATFSPDREETDAARFYPSSRSLAFKKSAWEKARGYPEWLYAAEDTLFNIRMRQLGLQFAFAKDAIVRWRPRETWSALAKQRFNFARGNARVGIGTQGYISYLKYLAVIFLLLLAGLLSPWLMLLSILPVIQHVRHDLLPHAIRAEEKSGRKGLRWYIVLVMAFVRLVSITGFLSGRIDRIVDRKYIRDQKNWMGTSRL